MNTYNMILYWQNKYLIMEKEVRKAQKGITRLKKREKYLNECIDNNNKFYENSLKNVPTVGIELFEKFVKEFIDEEDVTGKGSLKRNYHPEAIYEWFKMNIKNP